MGVISPVGNDVNTFWSNLCDGVCGIEAIKAFPTDLPLESPESSRASRLRQYGI